MSAKTFYIVKLGKVTTISKQATPVYGGLDFLSIFAPGNVVPDALITDNNINVTICY